jgi:hypothetical protein
MKGTLHKTKNGWEIRSIQATLNGPLLQSIPLHPDETDMDVLNPSPDGKEVEFATIPVCTNCGRDFCDNLSCSGDKDVRFARIIEPVITWDDIIKSFHIATQQVEMGSPPLIFECWLTDNYNPPTKK